MEVPGKQKDTYDKQSKNIASINVQLFCEPCDKDGLRLSAHGYCQDCEEHLCETCYNTHRKPAPCRHHVLLDKTQMPMSRSSGHTQAPHDLTEQCKLHKGKVIEYICHDHNIFGCSPCITTSHRNCKIDYIPDVSKDYETSDEYIQLLKSLEDLQKQFQTLVEDTKDNKKKVLENKSLVQIEIKKFRKEINDVLDNLEASLLKQAEEIFSKESERMESLSSHAVIFEKEIEKIQDDSIKLEKANNLNALYIYSKVNNNAVKNYTFAEKQANKDNYINNFNFQPNINLKKILRSNAGFGELQRQEIVGSMKTLRGDVGSFKMLQAKFCDEINVKTISENAQCCIPGVAVISKHTVAVVDSLNLAVKIVKTDTKNIISTKRLSSRPVTLELLEDNILSVVVDNGKTIVFLSISDGLTELRRLNLNGICNDLACSCDRLIVSFEWSGEIQIMNLDGRINQSIHTYALDNAYKCQHVAFGLNDNIYISDFNTHTISCMNLTGEILNTYKDERLVEPCGMLVLDDGSILVCSSGNNRIFLLSDNIERARVILEANDGLLCPWTLALDKEQSKLYVGSGLCCNVLKVYDLKIIDS